MPTPKSDETREEYLQRCIPQVLKEGTAKDNKQAAAICYSMWEKHTEKKADLTEFSLIVRTVGLNKKTGERYWKASTSDIFPDSYNDEMSLDLYRSFLDKIENDVKPPEQYRSVTWDGGMPYVSVSHYREHSIAGDTDKVYVDGAILKANGTFRDTPLGRACFEALWDDLYTKKSEEAERIRVSIAFLDYKHQHKSNGFVFTRSGTDEVCPECIKERKEKQMPGRIFLDGLLIHFAMTRVPVNGRTLMEVEKSMTTRKEDAESIVGDALAEELESKERSLIGKSDAVIIKSEEIVPETVERMMDDGMEEYRPFGGATSLKDAKTWVESSKEQQRVYDIWYAFQMVLSNIMSSDMEMADKSDAIKKCSEEFKSMVSDKNAAIFKSLESLDVTGEGTPEEAPTEDEEVKDDPVLAKMESLEKSMAEFMATVKAVPAGNTEPSITPVAHPLDEAFTQLKADYDSVILMEASEADKLREIQGSFNVLGSEIKRLMAEASPVEKSEVIQAPATDPTLLNVLQKLSDKLDLLTTMKSQAVVAPTSVPSPRSVSPGLVPQLHQAPQASPRKPEGPTPHLRALIDKSVGI